MISIIIPFYNAEKYIKSCINSLNKQTYQNYEAIFINDGSCDKSCKILEEYKNDKIILINNSKSGVSSARNAGLKAAKGEYITFLDVDDLYENNFLEDMLKAAEENNVDVVLCDYTEHYQDKDIIVRLDYGNTKLNQEVVKKKLIPAIIGKDGKEDKIKFVRALVWRTLIRRELYDKFEFEFDENVVIAEDLLFLLKVYLCANNIYVLSKNLYIYNRYIGSTLDRYVHNSLKKQLYFHEEFIKILKEFDLYEENKSRYAVNRLKMYMSAMSNCVRNPEKKQIRQEVLIIIQTFNDDKYIKNINCKLELIDKVNLILFKRKSKFLLEKIYTIKEKIRRKKLAY